MSQKRLVFWGAMVAALACTITAGYWLLAPNKACKNPERSREIQAQVAKLIPKDLVLSSAGIDDCGSGGGIYHEVVLRPGAKLEPLIAALGARKVEPEEDELLRFEKVVENQRTIVEVERFGDGRTVVSIELS